MVIEIDLPYQQTNMKNINGILLPSDTDMTQSLLNTLRPRQNGRHFADDILKCIFVNENVWIQIEISLKFIPKGPIDNIPALV